MGVVFRRAKAPCLQGYGSHMQVTKCRVRTSVCENRCAKTSHDFFQWFVRGGRRGGSSASGSACPRLACADSSPWI